MVMVLVSVLAVSRDMPLDTDDVVGHNNHECVEEQLQESFEGLLRARHRIGAGDMNMLAIRPSHIPMRVLCDLTDAMTV